MRIEKMFEGRHCTENDYALLADETDKVLDALSRPLDSKSERDIHAFLNVIASFDPYIADDICRLIKDAEGDIGKIRRGIIRKTGELKQNVLVDIREHK